MYVALQYGQENPLQLYSFISCLAARAVVTVGSALVVTPVGGDAVATALTFRAKILGNHRLHFGAASCKDGACSFDGFCGAGCAGFAASPPDEAVVFLISWITNG